MVNRFNENKLKEIFDLIIIGGGINGCGIARDASERGLKVLLLEKDDFASGCTSASSRLIHGGLRYLEYCEFDLVRESLKERELLLKNANHLVKPIELCIPIYKMDKRGYWIIKLGMTLYDLFSYDKSLSGHRMMSASDFIKHEPSVKKEGLIGGAVYFDSQVTYPERICVENIIMAKNNGAIVLNHVEVVDLSIQSNNISSIEIVDKLNGKKYKIIGKVIVNSSGPWVDSICGLTKLNVRKKIGGTKGSHIIIKQFKNGPKHAIYASAKSDNRPFFIIPWQRQNYYLIGTTDIPFHGNLNQLKADNNEIEYLIDEANNILDVKNINKNDILYSYSGVRPLPYVEGVSPSKITRKHIIFDHASDGIQNFISVVGGKLTTYRELSEQVVNLGLKKIDYKFIKSKTKNIALLGAVDGDFNDFIKLEIKKTKRKYGIDADIVEHLIDVYGGRYKEVLELTLTNNDLGYLLSSHSLDIRAQVYYSMKYEMAYTVTDVLLRRLSLGLSDNLGEDAVDYVLNQLKIFYQYSDSQIEQQKQQYYEEVVKLRKV